MAQNPQRKKSVTPNKQSLLLNPSENQTLFQLIGTRCSTLSSAVIQVYLADPPSCNRWNKRCCGVATFIKDNAKRSYFIRVYDLKSGNCIWEQEIYNQFKYKTPRPYFHTFDSDDCPAGLNFANEDEAKLFQQAVSEKLSARIPRRPNQHKTEAASLMEENRQLKEARTLIEENRQLKESRTCKVCMDEEINTVFLPCSHLVCCNNCAPSLRTCPICRALIRETVRIFLS